MDENIKKIIDIGRSFIGTTDNPLYSNNVIFNTDYYGKEVSGDEYPWNCTFLWDIFRISEKSDLFYNGNKCAFIPILYTWFKTNKNIFVIPKVGDIVFFKFENSPKINHCGIVSEIISDTKIKVIEGNTSYTSDDCGGTVMERIRTNKYIVGFGRIQY